MIIRKVLMVAASLILNSSHALANTEPLVFIHGFKGSLLSDAKGDQVWVGLSESLGFRTPNLALPTEWSSAGQARDSLHPTSILEKITVVPLLFDAQIYGPFIETVKKWKTPFFSFSYDWRRSNIESMKEFEKFIEGVLKETGAKQIQVVAHSNGGLITMALLNQRPELFSKVVFAGVPFSGGIGFLLDQHVGTATGLNKKILSPKVLFTFASVYTFYSQTTGNLIDRIGATLDANFYSIETWKNLKLGLFADPQVSEDSQKVQFLEKALAEAQKFRAYLKAPEQKLPPVFVIAGKSQPSLFQAIQGGPKSIRGWDFETAPKVEGDGRVCFKDAMPPKGVPYELILSKKEHSDLLNDPLVIERIRQLTQ